MNVLLIYPAFPYSFWSLDQTVRLLGRKALLPPLGLLTVAAILPQEWNYRLIDAQFQEVAEDDWDWADVVMLSGMFVQRKDLLDLIKEARERGIGTVIGGPYVTSTPQEALDAGADIVVRGELEPVRDDLIKALDMNKAGIIIENKEHKDLAISPVPRFDLLDKNSYLVVGVQSSRGCPFECEFCDIVHLFGRKPRYKSPQQISAELQRLYDLGWRKTIFICDDNFIGSRKHSKAILEELIPWNKSRNEPFGFLTQASVNLGQDQEMMDLLTEANFGEVFVGIESPDESVLNMTKKRQNVANPLFESITNMCKSGLNVTGSFVVGFDGEAAGADNRIRDFVEKANIPGVMLNVLMAIPNTAMSHRLEKEGRLLRKIPDERLITGEINFIPSRPESEILDEYRNLIDWLYEPRAYINRAFRYCTTIRPTRSALGIPPREVIPQGANGDGGLKFPDLHYVTALFKILWRHGVAAHYRWEFWKKLYQMWRRNPSRFNNYLNMLGFGENLFRLREIYLEASPKVVPLPASDKASPTSYSSGAVNSERVGKGAR
jgi:radical SAM superfamily enzyme YgiQ (UPF0313 family)